MKKRRVYLLHSLIFLLMMSGMEIKTSYAAGEATPLILRYDRVTSGGKVPANSIAFTFQDGLTQIQSNDTTIIIDYAHLYLYRYEKDRDSCLRFPLHDPTAGQPQIPETGNDFAESKIEAMGKVEVKKEGNRKDIQGYPCQQYIVTFGPDVLRMRTVMTPAIEQYGQLFNPLIAEIWTTSTLEGIDDLVQLAYAYGDIFQVNPLLRQLDPLGLLLQVQGVAVITKHGHTRETLREVRRGLRDGDTIVIPEECRLAM